MTATSRKAAILLAAAMLALTACGAQFAPGRSTDEVLEEEIYGNRGAPRSTVTPPLTDTDTRWTRYEPAMRSAMRSGSPPRASPAHV